MTETLVLPGPIAQPAPRRRRGVSAWLLATILLLIVLLAAGGTAGYMLLPTATIVVRPRIETVGPIPITVRADPLAVSTDLAEAVVPAQIVAFDLSVTDDFPATGKKVSETTAQGSVRWTNCDPTSAYTIPGGTIAKTSAGEAFKTAGAVFLPVAILAGSPPQITCQSRDVGVTAIDSGTGGNVPAGAIDQVPSDYNSVVIRVSNPAATTGGSHTETKIVAQKDVDAAVSKLTKAIRDAFTAQLADPAKPPSGTTLYPATKSMSAPEPTVDPASIVGDATATFKLGMNATGTATAVDPNLVRDLGAARVRAAVAQGRSLVADSVQVQVGSGRVSGSSVLFPVTATAGQVPTLDATAIRNAIKGVPIGEARERLRDYGDATLDVWPDWANAVTSFDFRLEVQVVSDVPTESSGPGGSAGPGSGGPGSLPPASRAPESVPPSSAPGSTAPGQAPSRAPAPRSPVPSPSAA